MEIVSVRQRPGFARLAVGFFQRHWAGEAAAMVYEDCILNCLDTGAPLPQWYLLLDGAVPVGGAGLITNDFVSRMDLWPWLCALYVEEHRRGEGLGGRLVAHAKAEAARLGYQSLYLCTGHVGYYERYGFGRIATGYHPWGERSSIFEAKLG